MTSIQEKILMEKFKTNPYLKQEQKHQLARSLNISVKRIESWYRRMRFSQRQKGLLVKGEYFQSKLSSIIHYILNVYIFRVYKQTKRTQINAITLSHKHTQHTSACLRMHTCIQSSSAQIHNYY